MESGDNNKAHTLEDQPSGLSSQVLDYYKRFGRHRDLEQYFSLGTVQGDVGDSGSAFWRTIKSQPDSDSGGHSMEPPSAEVCRISISCSVADPSSSRESTSKSEKNDPDSPPIINEDLNELPVFSPVKDEEKVDLDSSRKSGDLNLDNSANKLQSPTSSITSRKLEWDSLADVGYANVCERKISSSLSTIERMALQRQISISDEVKENISGNPNAYSTPFDEDATKRKKNEKKGLLKKVTCTTQKDMDVMEVSREKRDSSASPARIEINMTKHISFNVDPKTGAASVSNTKTVYNTEDTRKYNLVGSQAVEHKEIQTSLPNSSSDQAKHKRNTEGETDCLATVPVLLSLDVLKQGRYKGLRYYKAKMNKRKRRSLSHQSKRAASEQFEKNIPLIEVTGGGSQVSETDSFEYMPAHLYNQNSAKNKTYDQSNTGTSNKTSSLDSSGGYTTLSSKQSDHSLTKDLEKSIAILNKLIQHKHKDTELKKKLVKEVVQRLLKTQYRDDETTTDFLSGLSFNVKGVSLDSSGKTRCHTTTSTSDGNNSEETSATRLRKPILRSPKSLISIPSTKLVQETVADIHSPPKSELAIISNTKSTTSNQRFGKNLTKEKNTPQTEIPKTSSELLYKRYLEALKKEENYKEKLKCTEVVMQHELTQQDKEVIVCSEKEMSEKLKASSVKDLVKDLTKLNTSSKGAGDGIESHNPENCTHRNAGRFRTHSVFTMSSGTSDRVPYKPSSSKKQWPGKSSLGKKDSALNKCEKIGLQERNTLPKDRKSNLHYCCCPYHSVSKEKIVDSTKQLQNELSTEDLKRHISHSENMLRCNLPSTTNSKIVCFCSSDKTILDDIPDNFVIYKCCKYPFPSESTELIEATKTTNVQCSTEDITRGSFYEQNTEWQAHASNYNVYPSFIQSSRKQSRASKSARDQYTCSAKEKIKTVTDKALVDTQETKPTTKNVFKKDRSFPQSPRVREHRRFSETLDQFEKLNNNAFVDSCKQTSASFNKKINTPALVDRNLEIEVPPIANNQNDFIRFYDRTEDAYEISTLEDPLAPCCHPLSTFSHNNIPRRLRETEKFLDEILKSDELSERSKDSRSLPSYDENLFSYLDYEKSEDSPDTNEVCTQTKDRQDKSEQIIGMQERSTSMSDIQKKGEDVKLGPSVSFSRKTLDLNRPKSHEISTQVTPRDEKVCKQFEDISKINPMVKSRNFTRHHDYTTEWIENGDKGTVMTSEFEGDHDKQSVHKNSSCSTHNRNKSDRIPSKGEQKHKIHNNSLTAETSAGNSSESIATKADLIGSIENIIKRYHKEKIVTPDKKKYRRKRYKEIINKLQYLLSTDGTGDEVSSIISTDGKDFTETKRSVDSKSTQLKNGSSKCNMPREQIVYAEIPDNRLFIKDDSSNPTNSIDVPDTSETSFTCHIIGKIREECDKYHSKRCKCGIDCHSGYEASSSNSIHRQRSEIHHSSKSKCSHKSKLSPNRSKKKSIAYNLIIQPSDSLILEDFPKKQVQNRKLTDVIVKIPSIHKSLSDKNIKSTDLNIDGQHYYMIDDKKNEQYYVSKEIINEQKREQDQDIGHSIDMEKIQESQHSSSKARNQESKHSFIIMAYPENHQSITKKANKSESQHTFTKFVIGKSVSQNSLKKTHDTRSRHSFVDKANDLGSQQTFVQKVNDSESKHTFIKVGKLESEHCFTEKINVPEGHPTFIGDCGLTGKHSFINNSNDSEIQNITAKVGDSGRQHSLTKNINDPEIQEISIKKVTDRQSQHTDIKVVTPEGQHSLAKKLINTENPLADIKVNHPEGQNFERVNAHKNKKSKVKTPKSKQSSINKVNDPELRQKSFVQVAEKECEEIEPNSSKASTKHYESDIVHSKPSSACRVRKIKFLTVREYLERNRPDFISNTNHRQHCLQVLNETRLTAPMRIKDMILGLLH